MAEPPRWLQVLTGPRQVGKTTLARQVEEALEAEVVFASADGPTPPDAHWIQTHWDRARRLAESNPAGAVLMLDEVQKVAGWSEAVKELWDDDRAAGRKVGVLVLGSSALFIEQGLTESLAGRFEVTRMTHWSFAEMQQAFDLTLDRYVYFGGYPGAAPLIVEPERWRRYVLDSLIETTVSRDILLMTRVDKPALLRRVFALGCAWSGQVLSYQKMLGQLQDAGNTTTLAHYLELLGKAELVVGLPKFAGDQIRQRASSPKLLALNTALISAQSGRTFEEARDDPFFWGRLVESCVGAHLVNSAVEDDIEVTYWLERGREVDFVLRRGSHLAAIEVKSGRRRDRLSGLAAFDRAFGPARPLLVGGGGIPIDEFLAAPARAWLEGG